MVSPPSLDFRCNVVMVAVTKWGESKRVYFEKRNISCPLLDTCCALKPSDEYTNILYGGGGDMEMVHHR